MLRKKDWLYRVYSVGSVFWLLTYQSIPGCSDTGPSGPPPVGADIHGKWKGEFYRTDRGYQIEVTARVEQESDAVIIDTSKTEGVAQLLTGSISSNGYLRLTDANTGEKWTSYFGPASETNLVVADYAETPTIEHPEPGLYVLALHR
ncbi:MAG TPA: hypothetical protein P5567_04975 [Kiritimatiellia bacterium]|nr:hypothetical protein [Kiritimatiellia bacterium]HRZ11790.1 hypothetical protein [Kiritimatiellia bacterium]HSA17404.1 hypothetical protein [Kiritimatiellia bacterium]